MRRLRILLLLLLLGLLGWGATEAGLALGDRLAAAMNEDAPGASEMARHIDGPEADTGAGPAGSGQDTHARQRIAGSRFAGAPDGADVATGGPSPGAHGPSAADAARSASAAAFRRAMARLGARMGLTPDDPLGPVADAGQGDRDPFAAARSPWVDPSLEGPGAPGRAEPAKPAEPERIEVAWEGNGRFRSVITVDPGEGLRRPARVETYLASDPSRPIVTYDATAFRDQAGELHVDARGSQVSGPWSGNWSPDSFGIDDYGQVRGLDDQPMGSQGSVGSRVPR
jgi:hypothetical protein